MNKKLYFGDPNKKGIFHIFNEDRKSLCGGWSMPFTKFDEDQLVTGNEKCNSTDCKKCFEKLATSVNSEVKRE